MFRCAWDVWILDYFYSGEFFTCHVQAVNCLHGVVTAVRITFWNIWINSFLANDHGLFLYWTCRGLLFFKRISGRSSESNFNIFLPVLLVYAIWFCPGKHDSSDTAPLSVFAEWNGIKIKWKIFWEACLVDKCFSLPSSCLDFPQVVTEAHFFAYTSWPNTDWLWPRN